MSSQKTERLINLTLALLATTRYLSKAEIFRKIPGYEGSPETKERMFERDKDELRSLGIEIEVNNFDPLFEDDQGYLIKPESFQLSENEFSKEELLLLTMAANLWHQSAMSQDSQGALLKIQSLSGPVAADQNSMPLVRVQENSNLITEALSAIEKSQEIEFLYLGKKRRVLHYGLIINRGFWYLVAEETKVIKRFKILRIEGDIFVSKKHNAFSKPNGFDIKAYIEMQNLGNSKTAIARIRKGTCLNLRNKYEVTEEDETWDTLKISYEFDFDLLEMILWYGTDIELIQPKNLRSLLIKKLQELIND